jgi:hypothetical protein
MFATNKSNSVSNGTTGLIGALVDPGTLIYLDSFSGLVPARYVDTVPELDSVKVQVTATRGAYRRGETIVMSPRSVILRSQVVRAGVVRHEILTFLPARRGDS